MWVRPRPTHHSAILPQASISLCPFSRCPRIRGVGGNQEGELSLVQRPSLNLTPEFRAHCVAVTDSSTCDTESCYTYNFEVAAKEPRLRE